MTALALRADAPEKTCAMPQLPEDEEEGILLKHLKRLNMRPG
jgi:hypothetical protein